MRKHLLHTAVPLSALLLAACSGGDSAPGTAAATRAEAVHERFVFADVHAHPSRFHRANLEQIEPEEIARYQRSDIDLVVACVSSDAAQQGGYTQRDGTEVPRLRGNDAYDLEAGEAFAFTLDRFERILATVESGDAVLATDPDAVLEAKRNGKVALMAALEGADGLEGSPENLRVLHERGLRLLQLIHFLDNDLGTNQVAPYEHGGLTDIGREMVREANRLGIIVDLAHADPPTVHGALEVSEHPMIFSHTGAKALHDGDRYLADEEIVAIAAAGGLIGIWPAAAMETVEGMVAHIDHVKQLVGVDHIGIGSDLRGMSYLDAFGEEADFRPIVEGLFQAGYTDEEVGKIMGGNFFRLWQEVSRGAGAADPT